MIRRKLKPHISDKEAQTRLDEEIVQHLFVERVPEFEGNTRAVRAEVDLSLGESEWEKIATLEQLLRVHRFKNYELWLNVPDAQVLREMADRLSL